MSFVFKWKVYTVYPDEKKQISFHRVVFGKNIPDFRPQKSKPTAV